MGSAIPEKLARHVTAMVLDEFEVDGKTLRAWIEEVKRFRKEQDAGKWVEARKLETVVRERDRLREKLAELKTGGSAAPASTVWSMDPTPEKAANVLRNTPTAGVLRRACLMGAEALQRKRAPGHGFYMTDDEIRSSWRRCASQLAQVQVLADLNCVSAPTMKKKLQEMGLYQPKEKKTCSTE